MTHHSGRKFRHPLLHSISLIHNHKVTGIGLDLETIRAWDTSLSSSARERLLLDWEPESRQLNVTEAFSTELITVVGEYIKENDFIKFANFVLKPLAKSTSVFINACCPTVESFKRFYEDETDWLKDDVSLETWFELYSQEEYYSSLLLGVSVVERLVGDAVFAYNGGDTAKVPLLIRDLLAMSCLREMIGDELCFILNALIGPPATMNLRNILWHGFLSPLEVCPSPAKELSSLLLMIWKWVARRLMSFNLFASSTLQRRRGIVNGFRGFFEASQSAANAVFDDGSFEDAWEQTVYEKARPPWYSPRVLEQLAIETGFFPYGTQHQVRSSVRFLESNPLLFLISSVPILEHSLRRLYISVNPLVREEKLQTSEDELFVVMDTILSEVVDEGLLTISISELEPVTKNLLFCELGNSIMQLMLDLFQYPSGPRLRDRVSHGESNNLFVRPSAPFELPPIAESIIRHYTALLAYLMYRYAIFSAKYRSITGLTDMDFEWATVYKPRFHPLALVEKLLAKSSTLLCFLIKISATDFRETGQDDLSLEVESHVSGGTEVHLLFSFEHMCRIAARVSSANEGVLAFVTAWKQRIDLKDQGDGVKWNKYGKTTKKQNRILCTVENATRKTLIALDILHATTAKLRSGAIDRASSSRKRRQAAQTLQCLPVMIQRLCCTLLVSEVLVHDEYDWMGNIEKRLPSVLRELLVFAERLVGFARQGRWMDVDRAFKAFAKAILHK